MMKILIIMSTRFGYDGITSVVENYYLYQNHDGITMDMVTLNPVNEKMKQAMKNNGDCNFVLPYRNKNPFQYFLQLIKIIKKGNYQIVHAHGGSCTMAVEMAAAKLAGVKVRVAHSHNTASDYSLFNNILKPIFLRTYTDGFACGKEAGDWLFSGNKFSIISNGIDLDRFEYNEQVRNDFKRAHKLEEKYVVGHIGRFNEQKNHTKVITVFEEFCKLKKNAILVLIGDGERREEIERLVKDKNINAVFVGLSDEIPQWLQAMDVMLLPSLYEGLPVTIVEAQAAGLPCVISNTISKMTAVTELVEFVELSASDRVWAEKLEQTVMPDRMQNKDIVRRQMKERHFDIRENCREMKKKYEELICQKSV